MAKRNRKDPETLKAEKAARVESMENALEAFDLDEDDKSLMRAFNALCEHYSENNAMLILAQAADLGLKVKGPDDVAAYGTWLARGRQVREGQSQTLFIWQPCGQAATADKEHQESTTDEKTGEKTTTRKFFRVAGLFHITQTDKKVVQAPPVPAARSSRVKANAR